MARILPIDTRTNSKIIPEIIECEDKVEMADIHYLGVNKNVVENM